MNMNINDLIVYKHGSQTPLDLLAGLNSEQEVRLVETILEKLNPFVTARALEYRDQLTTHLEELKAKGDETNEDIKSYFGMESIDEKLFNNIKAEAFSQDLNDFAKVELFFILSKHINRKLGKLFEITSTLLCACYRMNVSSEK